MKKILFALAALLLPLTALAVQISVPSAPGAGYGLTSVSTGQYVASSTTPLIAGSNITFTGGTPYVFGPSVTISASGGSSSFAYPFIGNATTTAITFTGGLVSGASTTISYLGSGLVGSNNGRLYSLGTSTLSASISGNAATATALATGRTIGITGDITYTSPSFDGSGNVTAAGTLATVNSNVGSFTNASFTVNAKGLITAASSGSVGNSASSTLLSDTNTWSGLEFFNATTTHTAITLNAAQAAASISTGGAFKGICTNDDGVCALFYTNHGSGANGRTVVINGDNTAFDQNVLYIRAQSQTTTAVNIQGAPNGQGLLKLDIGAGGNTGNNNTALFSCDTTDHTSYAQCAFFKGNSATTTAILYAVDASSNTAFKVDGNRLTTFIWASSTALSATSLCLGTDCRTAWPSSVGSGLATSSPTSAGNLLAYTATGAGSAYGVATTSATINNGLTGTLTTLGTGQTIGLATINAGVLGAQTNGVVPTSQATSSLYGTGVGGQVLAWNNNTGGLAFMATSSSGGGGSVTAVTGTWPILSSGGTAPNITFGGFSTTTALTGGQLVYSDGTNVLTGVSTTTVSCSGSITCTTFNVLGSSPITLTGAGGGGTGNIATSSNESPTQIGVFSSKSGSPALLKGSSNFQFDETNRKLGLGTTTQQNRGYTILSGGFLFFQAGGSGQGVAGLGSDATTTGASGGFADLIGGIASTSGQGGQVHVTGGAGSQNASNGTGLGGTAKLTGGAGGASNGNGGQAQIFGGAGVGSGNGGDTYLQGGAKGTTGIAGHVLLGDPVHNNAIIDNNQLASSDKIFSFPNVTGTFGVGSATTTSSLSYWLADSSLGAIATTSVTCSGTVSCSGFTVLGSSPITISGSGGAFSFTPSSYNGIGNNASTTGLMLLPTSGYGLIASSTFTTYASTTNFSSSGDTWLATSGSNKVGIGTTSPSAALSIDGGTGPNNVRVCQGAGNSCVQFGFTASGNQAASIGTLSNAGTFYMTNGINRLNISNSGFIGIATTTSQWPLEILSATKPQLDLFDGSGIDANHWTLRSAGGFLYFSPSTFAATTTTALTINANGQLGIGTTTPGTALMVQGGAIINSEIDLATSTTMYVNAASSTAQRMRILAANITVNLAVGTTSAGAGIDVRGEALRLQVCNGGTTAGTVTFAASTGITNVLYPAATAPTHTTTVNKCDLYGITFTGATSTTGGITAEITQSANF